jgi:tetratricopeptide (TPR) repeat protein
VDERKRAGVCALLLFGAAFLLYARTASFDFIEFDDPQYVRENPHIAGGLSLDVARWAATSTDYQYNWHPLTWLSHALDVECFGLASGRHHLVNAGWHALNAVLLFGALRALTGRLGPSVWVAALFALHPLRVESVAWIAQRKDVLAGAFFGATLWAYARHARAPSGRGLAWVSVWLAAGLASKPTLVSVPFLLLLLDVWPLGRLEFSKPRASALVPLPSQTPTHPVGTAAKWLWGNRYAVFLEKLPLFALALLSAGLTLGAQQAGGAVRDLSLAERLPNAFAAYGTYVSQFLAPLGLAPFYPHPVLVGTSVWSVQALAGVLVLLACSGLAILHRRHAPWLAIGLLWFLGLLVPMIGLVQVGNQAHADRYAYLAQIGLELALVWSVTEWVAARPALRPGATVLGGAGLVALAGLSWRQIGFWKDSETLFGHALEVTSRSFVMHTNLGLALAREGRLDEALEHWEAAVAARPGFYQAERNRGVARFQRGEFQAARTAFERALASEPRSGEAHLFLASACARLRDLACAETELAKALECAPELSADSRVQRLEAELAALRSPR